MAASMHSVSPQISPNNCISREVSHFARGNARCREIIINTGGAPSPLQDIKIADSAGGYCYHYEENNSPKCVRNRFIYWRVHHDVLELSEQSLDLNLQGNCVRYRFPDTPILYGITVHETRTRIVVLVATVSSVHKLYFQHPGLGASKHSDANRSGWSILADASVTTCLSYALHSYLSSCAFELQTCSSHLDRDEIARFALVTNTSSIILVAINREGGVAQTELKHTTVMQRLWTGLVPSVIRGSRQCGEMVLSLCFYPVDGDLLLYTICKDHRIRVWSCVTQECLVAVDVHEFIPSHLDINRITTGVGGHLMRVSSNALPGQSPYLALFLSYTDHSKFCILDPLCENRQHRLQHVATIAAPNEDLVDFCLTNSMLAAVWTNSESDTTVRTITISSDTRASWCDIHLESAESSELIVPSHKDPSEAYVEAVFMPGRFSTKDIIRALNIYRGSPETIISAEDNISTAVLRDEVVNTVENEIAALCEYDEMPADDYYNLQIQQWGRFYSSCVHYHQVGVKTVGMFLDRCSGLGYLVKKESISVLRPCDITELIWLSAPVVDKQHYYAVLDVGPQGINFHEDVLSLMDILYQLDSLMTPDIVLMFDHEVHLGEECPESLARQLVPVLDENVTPGGQSVWEIMQRMPTVTDPVRAVANILDVMDVTPPENLEPRRGSVEYSSDASMSLLCRSSHHLIETRLHFLRQLLLVETLMVDQGQQAGVGPNDCVALSSVHIPRTAFLLQTYYAVRYLFTCTAHRVQSDTMDSNLRQLAALDLSGRGTSAQSSTTAHHDYCVGELFLKDVGCELFPALLSGYETGHPSLLWTLPLEIIWPTAENTLLCEYMVQTCQYDHLARYLSLLPPGIDQSARSFLRGQCCLNNGESEEALNLFLEAASGVRDDVFINRKLLQSSDAHESVEQRTVKYYLKVIKLFEQFQCADLVIKLTDVAIEIALDDDPNLPTFWSMKFKHLLESGHVDEAYAALINNPDPDGLKDCLRQFVVVLCDRNQLQQLVQFPYLGIYDDVVHILETRARSSDLAAHNYYDLLHAFHVFRGNYRRAATTQYEHALRLGRESHGVKGLQRQAKCYLAAMNALRLVHKDYAWIVMPVSEAQQKLQLESEIDGGASPKRDSDDNVIGSGNAVQKLQVIELKEIEKQYVLLHARLKLIQKEHEHPHSLGPTPGADELADLLVNAGLYDAALRVSNEYALKLDVVFNSLTSRCIWLSQGSQTFMIGDNEYTAQAWSWLSDNLLEHAHSSKEISAVDQAWRLLKSYLSTHESASQSRYHRCIATKLLAHGYQLPGWLLTSYKARNMPELLRLYMTYNCLEEAAKLVMEYVAAVLGNGTEYFGLKTSLHYAAPPVTLPYTSIDQLLWALKDTQVPQLVELYNQLRKDMDKYFETLRKVSQDKIDVAVGRREVRSA